MNLQKGGRINITLPHSRVQKQHCSVQNLTQDQIITCMLLVGHEPDCADLAPRRAFLRWWYPAQSLLPVLFHFSILLHCPFLYPWEHSPCRSLWPWANFLRSVDSKLSGLSNLLAVDLSTCIERRKCSCGTWPWHAYDCYEAMTPWVSWQALLLLVKMLTTLCWHCIRRCCLSHITIPADSSNSWVPKYTDTLQFQARCMAHGPRTCTSDTYNLESPASQSILYHFYDISIYAWVK